MKNVIHNLFLLVIVISFAIVNAQFGVTKETPKTATEPETLKQSDEILTQLTEQDALDIRSVIEAAGEDPDTIKLVASLKEENAAELEELKNTPVEEILHGLKMTLDEMKILDYLFQDPVKALEAMEAENLIPAEHLPKYKANPALLEEDTRRALYFRFISLCVVGGYL